jgi:adenosyl cobinamide kinase/adenosyl cobinamide phosphate guanylyltransferase
LVPGPTGDISPVAAELHLCALIIIISKNQTSTPKPNRREEIDKHYDSRFRSTWATNKHKARLDQCTVEDERVFLRGINAFVTNKEVWENPKTRERKVMFATKVLAKSNGDWALVHVHTGDGSQIEVNSNGQMKRKW